MPTHRTIPFAIAILLALFVYAQSPLQIGYATLTPGADSTVPGATALLRNANADGVVSETSIPAVQPALSGLLYIDESETRTGLVFVNPSDQTVSITLLLRDASGAEAASRVVSIGPHRHAAQFAAELFGTSAANLTGSLMFRSDQPLAAAGLRQNFNARGEAIYTALPVIDPRTEESASAIIPYIRSIDGFFTTVVLLNRSDQPSRGRVQVHSDPRIENPYDIPPNGIQRMDIGVIPEPSFAEVTPEPGTPTPGVLALIQSKFAGGMITETVLPQVPPSPAWRIPVETSAGTQTRLSLANPGTDPASVTFTLIDRFGTTMSTFADTLPPQSLLVRSAGELFPGVSSGFLGQIGVESSVPVSVVVIRTIETRNDSLLASFPAADLTRQSAGALILPQVIIGSGFSTRLILVNRDTQAAAIGQIAFVNSDGGPMTLPVPDDVVSGTSYTLDPRGSRQLFPGNTAPVSGISLRDPLTNEAATELTINEGDAVRPNIFVTDVSGNARDDFKILLTATNPSVASIDPTGAIVGFRAGYSSLVIAIGGRVEPYTITVVGVEDGVPGFGYRNPAADAAGKLYWTSSGDHTILLTQDLRQAPAVWAGIPRSSGLHNDLRLASRFHNPAYVAVRAAGTVYVTDSNNHVVRQILPGPDGHVSTIAGIGSPGEGDGVDTAAFRNPQGIALDDRGYIWVADSGNHTIRRVHPLTGEVTTVAGQAGERGLADGVGVAARFDSPMGIAAEPAPLSAQVSRRGQPLPVRMIVADTGNGVIRRVTEDGTVETISQAASSSFAAQIENGPTHLGAGALTFNNPVGVAVDAAGTIYVVEEGNVRALLPNQSIVRVAQAGTLARPRGIAITNSRRIVVSDDEAGPRQIRFGSPQLSSVTPDRISSRGGASITIRGQNFAPETSVILAGTVIQDVQIPNTETIILTAPSLQSGRTTLTVQNRGGIAQRDFFIEPIPIENLPSGSITTLAGGATFTGDGGPAIDAPISIPEQTAIDAVGNIYIADTGHHRIRKVDHLTGIIVTVAGNGDAGFSGDGDLAIAAQLSFPSGIALDGSGNIFISDSGNRRIRKVDAATGRISTFAAPPDNSGDAGATIAVNLNAPRGLAFDLVGNLYVADTSNQRILKITPDGMVTTVAGNGQSTFSGDDGPATAAALNAPRMIAVDASGNLWIADTGNNRIRRVDTEGIIRSIDAGALNSPRGVAVSANGDVFIADSGNHRIVSAKASGSISLVAGNGRPGFSGDGGLATEASLNDPYGVTVDGSGILIIADRGNSRIRKIAEGAGRLLTPFGVLQGLPAITTVAGNGQPNDLGDGAPATAAQLLGPSAVVSDAVGNLYIADSGNLRIRRVDRTTGIIATVAGTGRASFNGDEIPATEASISAPQGLALGADGSLFIADTQNHRIRRIDPGGFIHTFAGTGVMGYSGDNLPADATSLSQPTGLAIDSEGNLYIADSGNHRIRKVAAATLLMTTLAGNGSARFSSDGGPAAEASLATPRGVAVDEAGNVYIADSGNNRVRRVDARTLIIQTVAGTGDQSFYGDDGPAVAAALSFPLSVAVDRTGDVLILDSFNQRLRKLQMSTGIIRTVAGIGFPGFSGDNGPATEAMLFSPAHVSIDPGGNILIADTVNSRIRAIAFSSQ